MTPAADGLMFWAAFGLVLLALWFFLREIDKVMWPRYK
jgi:hypothetical protein